MRWSAARRGAHGGAHRTGGSDGTLPAYDASRSPPTTSSATHAEAAGNEREPLLVLEPLREFLTANGLAAPDDLKAEPIGEGHSNVTFILSTGVVLRRPPRGPLPPSAHDVLREARLLRALEPTPVRAPRVLAVGDDTEVIGAPVLRDGRGDRRRDHRHDARAARQPRAARG